jgi:hypothetical protein
MGNFFFAVIEFLLPCFLFSALLNNLWERNAETSDNLHFDCLISELFTIHWESWWKIDRNCGKIAVSVEIIENSRKSRKLVKFK